MGGFDDDDDNFAVGGFDDNNNFAMGGFDDDDDLAVGGFDDDDNLAGVEFGAGADAFGGVEFGAAVGPLLPAAPGPQRAVESAAAPAVHSAAR